MSKSKLVIVRGHALRSIHCDGTVPNRAHAECECGWMCITYSSVRARDAHRDHKLAIASVLIAKRHGLVVDLEVVDHA